MVFTSAETQAAGKISVREGGGSHGAQRRWKGRWIPMASTCQLRLERAPRPSESGILLSTRSRSPVTSAPCPRTNASVVAMVPLARGWNSNDSSRLIHQIVRIAFEWGARRWSRDELRIRGPATRLQDHPGSRYTTRRTNIGETCREKQLPAARSSSCACCWSACSSLPVAKKVRSVQHRSLAFKRLPENHWFAFRLSERAGINAREPFVNTFLASARRICWYPGEARVTGWSPLQGFVPSQRGFERPHGFSGRHAPPRSWLERVSDY